MLNPRISTNTILMKCKNKLLHFALRMLPIPKHPLTMQRRILVVTTTALGDTLWATPAIESLRSSWPNAYIAVLTSPIGWQVLQNNPWIDRLYPLREPLSLHCFSLWKRCILTDSTPFYSFMHRNDSFCLCVPDWALRKLWGPRALIKDWMRY